MMLAGPLALLAGCAGSAGPCNPAATPAFPPSAADDQCGAALLARFAGAVASDEIRATIAAAAGERRVRYIAPGDAVTQDYRIDRLNVELGEDGRIVRFRCG